MNFLKTFFIFYTRREVSFFETACKYHGFKIEWISRTSKRSIYRLVGKYSHDRLMEFYGIVLEFERLKRISRLENNRLHYFLEEGYE